MEVLVLVQSSPVAHLLSVPSASLAAEEMKGGKAVLRTGRAGTDTGGWPWVEGKPQRGDSIRRAVIIFFPPVRPWR